MEIREAHKGTHGNSMNIVHKIPQYTTDLARLIRYAIDDHYTLLRSIIAMSKSSHNWSMPR